MPTTTLKQFVKRRLSERQWQTLAGLAQAARSPGQTLLRPYFSLRASWPVWFYLLNREGRRRYGERPPELTPLQQRIAGELSAQGIAATHLRELFPDQPRLLDDLQRETTALMGRAETKTGKRFLRELWDVMPRLEFQDPFVNLALDETILGIVNTYFAMYAKFYYLTLNLTLPVGTEAAPVQSQRWHRDPEDKRVCKLFLYLTDVDEEAGPFIYIPGSHYGGRWGRLCPQQPPRGCYPPAEAIERAVPPEARKVCTGTAGTVLFCDTSGLHKGGYARSKERIMFTAGYYSRASLWPVRYRRPEDDDGLPETLGGQARYALQPFRHRLSGPFFRRFFKPNLTY